jgi:hypothetical protein
MGGEFELRGRYWYKIGSSSNPYEWKICEGCGKQCLIARRSDPARGRFCSQSCQVSSRTGKDASHWRGDDAGYFALHGRVYQQRGKASECVWSCESRYYEWANLTGNYLDIWDYAQMCRRCHKRFDGAIRMMHPDRDNGRRWYPAKLGAEPGPQRGSRRYNAKLTETLVAEAKLQRAAGVPLQELAAALGVSNGTLSEAVNERSWRHVPVPTPSPTSS